MKHTFYACIFSFCLTIYPEDHHPHHTLASHGHDTHHEMTGMYGTYSMNRESSGTSWVPDSSPLEQIHFMSKGWDLMVGGFSYLVYDNQAGRLGEQAIFDENMFMFMGHKKRDQTLFGFRTMISLEPLTMPKCGYPLLFQTGETCNGITPLTNIQHPHDLFMELALTCAHLFTKETSAFLYIALPGEPALGPPIFIMRFASEYIPAAPLGHHWLDSTHISYGVITGGLIHHNLKLEISGFNGREPDQHRFDIEKPKIDSYSFRLSYNPNEQWALQVSYGFLKSPEESAPNVSTHRTTLSAIYNKSHEDYFNWQTIVALGINNNKPGHTLPAFLWDSTCEYKKRHVLFSRFESVVKDELFIEPDPLAHKTFLINKFSFGYIYEFTSRYSKWGLGGSFDAYIIPPKVENRYKIESVSYMLFLQYRLIDF